MKYSTKHIQHKINMQYWKHFSLSFFDPLLINLVFRNSWRNSWEIIYFLFALAIWKFLLLKRGILKRWHSLNLDFFAGIFMTKNEYTVNLHYTCLMLVCCKSSSSYLHFLYFIVFLSTLISILSFWFMIK